MMYFRPNIEMRPCEKVYVRQRVAHVTCGRCGFPHTRAIHLMVTQDHKDTLKQLGAVTQEQAILVGGRVGNVACEDQVRLCHLSGVQAEAWEHLRAGRTIRGRSPFTLGRAPRCGIPSGSCKGASWEEIVRLMAENVTLETPKGA
jgi:hypothetical protein